MAVATAISEPSSALYQHHRTLLREFGGITERANEPDESWLLNTNDSLTQEESRHDASFMIGHSAFDEMPGGIPIEVARYYSISGEANGNTTICHRDTGEVLLFAADHSFSDVVPMEGWPPYTLYRRPGGDTFLSWAEMVATQWESAL